MMMRSYGHLRAAKAAFGAAALGMVLVVAWAGPRPAPDAGKTEPAPGRLIDGFSSSERKSPLGTQWEFLTDQVMGGVSAGAMEMVQHEQRTCLHLTGSVSLANRGGFIQARLLLHPKGRNFNAQAYDGIRLTVKGNGQTYAVHLRTKDTRLPWQYYQAEFATDGQWQEIKLPLKRFKPVSLSAALSPAHLRTVAVVAAKKEFDADLFVDQLSFYSEKPMYRELTPQEEYVIINKGTERPFTGRYNNHFENGVYTCRRCGAELYESTSKFKSQCGWPSFDDQVPGAVKWQPDADGVRTEIVCANCGGHLGHVFRGEGYTSKNTRHCVNSISMDFVPAAERNKAKAEDETQTTERAIFASGCFWGTEYHLQRAPGVISTTVGYTGGHVEDPTYKQVCTDTTGHAEAVEVIYDPAKTSYEQLARLFFETHDFTQLNRQGPDIGRQYRSEIFYLSDEQKQTAEQLIGVLREKGFDVKTAVTAAGTFWPAENYHQDYYNKTQKTPYCHIYRPIF